jgi:hypothetical protein
MVMMCCLDWRAICDCLVECFARRTLELLQRLAAWSFRMFVSTVLLSALDLECPSAARYDAGPQACLETAVCLLFATATLPGHHLWR